MIEMRFDYLDKQIAEIDDLNQVESRLMTLLESKFSTVMDDHLEIYMVTRFGMTMDQVVDIIKRNYPEEMI